MAARDKALARLLSSFGDERFEELKDELLYVEDFDEEDGPVTGLESEIARETTIEEVPVSAVMAPMSEQLSIPLDKIIPNESPVETAATVYTEPAPVQQAPVVSPVMPVSQTVQQDAAAEAINVQQIADAEAIAREEARQQAKEEARKLLTQPVVQISAEQRKTVSQINRESREKRVIHPIESQKRYNIRNAKSADGAKTPGSQDKSDVAVKSSLKKILDESDAHK